MSDEEFERLLSEVHAMAQSINDIAERELKNVAGAFARGEKVSFGNPDRLELIERIDVLIAMAKEAYRARGPHFSHQKRSCST